MASGLPELSLRERVLLWLDHVAQRSGDEGGVAATQAGIAHATGMSRAHVSRTLAPLLEAGLLAERDERVPGFARLLRTYRLTSSGEAEARRLGASLAGALVDVRRAGLAAGSLPLGQAVTDARSRPTLFQAVERVRVEGALELGNIAPESRPRFVRDLDDAPDEKPLYGRAIQEDALRRWIEGGRPRVGLLLAPGGFGKSALVARSLRAPAPAAHVLYFRVEEGVRGARLVEAIDQVLARLGRPPVELPDEDARSIRPHLEGRVRGFPLLLVVDDVHKAGAHVRRVLEALAYIALAQPTFHLLLVGREIPINASVASSAWRLDLPPLDEVGAATMIAALGASPEVRTRTIAAARGVPLLLEILARSPREASQAVDLARELPGLLPSPEAQAALAWCALARGAIDARLLADLGAGSPLALDELHRAGVATRREDGRIEVHDIVREAALARIPFVDRPPMHARLAEAYARRVPEGLLESLHHLVKAGKREEAAKRAFRERRRLLAQAESRFSP